MTDASSPGEVRQISEFERTWHIINGVTIQLTQDEVEQVVEGGLTRVPAPEYSEHDYVEIEVKDD